MFTWEAKWTQTGMILHFSWKSHFCVQSALYLYSYELRRNETQNGMDFISVILTEVKFQAGMRFSCEYNLPETKWISAGSLDVAFNAHVRLKLSTGMVFVSVILTDMKFHHVNNTRNEMPSHVHQNIGSFWNVVEMKLHVNKTYFHAGLKSQTGKSSFCLSCEPTLWENWLGK